MIHMLRSSFLRLCFYECALLVSLIVMTPLGIQCLRTCWMLCWTLQDLVQSAWRQRTKTTARETVLQTTYFFFLA